ncbi:secretin N-terminal domain-containing protein [Methyloradius palustris]|uniref:Secretin/TonB short N-terminal domain-containing protein n=1 Tax=Methyloradius palustris TaxID=2778876 RepID=A0A8D5JRN2_9PROT|nr:secretin N-terminal domain-containing protein [Methyloradius palustris]BCM25646.1 hypothetical protein ZMTM_19050 [Methyloradius palustris]
MSKARGLNLVRTSLLLLTLTACATQPVPTKKDDPLFEQAKTMINTGRANEGITKLEQLVADNPDNIEYRSYLQHQQDNQQAQRLSNADQLRLQRRWADADILYQQVLEKNPQNQRALEGERLLGIGMKHEKMVASAQALFIKNDLDGAQNIVRDVLAENSNNQAARALYESIEQQRIDKQLATPEIKSAFKKPITLEFKDIPIKSVFEFISRASNINFTFDQELRSDQRISIYVRNTTIEDAIQVILTTNQLQKKVLNDNTLLIYPNSRSQEYQELFVRSFYLGNIDAKRAMNMVKAVVKTKDIYIDEKLNTLVMRDTADAIKTAEKLITSQDLADPEVMLEVEVLEINRQNLEALGMTYPNQVSVGVKGQSTTSTGTGAATPGQLTFTELQHFNSGFGVFSISDPVLALNLLNQYTDTDLLANPHIRVKNREKAKIHIGDRIPVITSIANATGFVSESVSYIEVGIKLDVEPTILLNNEVSIKVGLEVSNQTGQVRTSSGTVTYTIGTRNADTVLRLKDGETQVLAGLFRDDKQYISNRVPGLAGLPLIGGLFADKNSTKQKKEIVLLITPRILSNISPVGSVYTTFPSGIDANRGVNKSGKQQDVAAPVSLQVVPVQTSQEIQADRAQADKAFADSVMQPVQEVADPNNRGTKP